MVENPIWKTLPNRSGSSNNINQNKHKEIHTQTHRSQVFERQRQNLKSSKRKMANNAQRKSNTINDLTEIRKVRRQWNDIFIELYEKKETFSQQFSIQNIILQKQRLNKDIPKQITENVCCKQKYLRMSFRMKRNDTRQYSIDRKK